MGVYKNLRRGKSGKRFGISYRDASGRLHQRIVSNNRQEAEREYRRVMDEIDRGVFLSDGGKITLGEYSSSWLSSKKVDVRPTTWRAYRTHVNNYIISPQYGIASVRIRALNLTQLKAFKVFIGGPDSHLSPKTVNSILTTLGGILEEAKLEGHISSNPARNLQKLPVPHREMDFLRPGEVPGLLQFARETHWALYVAVSFSIFTGARRSELLPLRYEDFDCQGEYPVVHIRRSYQGSGRFGEPKSQRSRRDVNLCGFLVRLIAEHRLRMGNPPGSALVFDRGDGFPLDPDHLSRKLWKKLLRTSGLRESLRWHDLRHTYASLLLSQNEPLKAISNLMGHSSIQITADRYAHLLPSACQGAADRLEETVFGSSDDDNSLTMEVAK